MSARKKPRPDDVPMLPEVERFWPPLLRGAALILDPGDDRNMTEVVPSGLKPGEWVEFACAAAFLVADLAAQSNVDAEQLRKQADELVARAIAAKAP